MGVTPPFLSRPARAVERVGTRRPRWKVQRLRRRDGQERQTRDGPDRRERLERDDGPATRGRGAARCRSPAARRGSATATTAAAPTAAAALLASDGGLGRGGGGLAPAATAARRCA